MLNYYTYGSQITTLIAKQDGVSAMPIDIAVDTLNINYEIWRSFIASVYFTVINGLQPKHQVNWFFRTNVTKNQYLFQSF